MKCFIESRRGSGTSDPEREGSSDSSPGLTGLPESLLFRHGALVLNPGAAVTIPGAHPPRPTVYRARTLMVPSELEPGPALDAINRVLARVGMRLVLPSLPRPDQAGAAIQDGGEVAGVGQRYGDFVDRLELGDALP